MLTVIVNPTAGSGDAVQVAARIKEQLEQSGRAYRMLYTEEKGHATALSAQAVKQGDCEAVIAVGGDGTVLETARGLVGSDVPLGIIPAGTGNDFIKSVGTPKDPMAALDFILTHQPRPVDVGLANDELFLNVAGTGFDVMVLDETVRYKARFRGLTPYLLGLIRAISHYRPTHMRVVADGKVYDQDALICSIANGRFFGGGIPICPEAQPDDGSFDLVLVNDQPRWKIPFYLPALMMGKLTQKSFTTHLHCRELTLSSPGMRFNTDGEVAPVDEVRIRIIPGGMHLYW